MFRQRRGGPDRLLGIGREWCGARHQRLGPHTFTVTATDSDGQVGTAKVNYTVLATPQPSPTLAISAVTESAKKWVEGRALARISARSHLPVGTTFSVALSMRASVTFAFARIAPGRKVASSCVAPTNKNRHRRKCTRPLPAGALTFAGHAGANLVRFQGLISRHLRLPVGSYVIQITATAPGQHPATAALHFTIASPPSRH